MSTALTSGAARSTDVSPQVPLGRLVQVELRKLTDTRAGRWLLLTIALLTAAVVTIFLFAAPPEVTVVEDDPAV